MNNDTIIPTLLCSALLWSTPIYSTLHTHYAFFGERMASPWLSSGSAVDHKTSSTRVQIPAVAKSEERFIFHFTSAQSVPLKANQSAQNGRKTATFSLLSETRRSCHRSGIVAGLSLLGQSLQMPSYARRMYHRSFRLRSSLPSQRLLDSPRTWPPKNVTFRCESALSSLLIRWPY